jgi:hypothetical protein
MAAVSGKLLPRKHTQGTDPGMLTTIKTLLEYLGFVLSHVEEEQSSLIFVLVTYIIICFTIIIWDKY